MALYKKIVSSLLVVAMLISFSACSASTGKKYTFSNAKQNTVKAKSQGEGYHKTNTETLELICKSGLVEMYLDKSSYSVVIKDASSGQFWCSLPIQSVEDASVLSLNVSKDETLYKLNSQDNSVAYGKANFEKKDNGIWITYTLSEKKLSPKISVPITVKYTLSDGSFYVDISCKKIAELEDVKVENIELLKYFGATNAPQDGDFMLLPDGCGAKINTAVETKEQNYDIKVYGEDYASPNSVTHTGVVPSFGSKVGTGAFAAVIRSGDSLATISATKAKKGDYSTIGSVFSITPTSETTEGEKKEKYVSKQSYDGNLSVCYRFLTGSNATYSGMASVCREQLIRDAVLSTRTVQKTGEYPVNISLIGMAKTSKFKNTKLTTFKQAQDIVEILKAKGINSLNLRYKGIFSDGLEQSNLKSTNLLRRLGSKKDFNELYDYMSTQGLGLFVDINMLTMDSGSRAKAINNKKAEISFQNELNKYFEPNEFESNLVKSKSLEKNVVSFLTEVRDLSFSGICVNDAGSILYSDFSNDLVTREKMKELISEQMISLSTNRETMTETGNFFMLKNVEYIENIPMQTTYKESNSYQSIPFVQMILHGMIEYSGTPVNLADDYTKSFLKSIEYGTILSYELTFKDAKENGKKESELNLCYEDWTSKIAEGYNSFNQLFSDLRDARMTNHYVAAENLMCTVYDNGTYIYVNYSSEDINYNNLVVKANSYLRVN